METLEKVRSSSSFYKERYRPFFIQVARFVSKHGGTLEIAEDLYHDALIIYYEKVLSDFELQTSEEAYIMGIVKNLWSRQLANKSKLETLTSEPGIWDEKVLTIDDLRLYKIILSAGKKCLDLLNLFYSHRFSLADIASKLGFGSEHSTAVQKYKCLEKIRETIKQNSLRHEDFFE